MGVTLIIGRLFLMKSRFFRDRARNVPEPGDGIIVLVIDIFLPVVFKKIDSFYDFPDQHEGNFCLKLRLHPKKSSLPCTVVYTLVLCRLYC